MIRDRKVGTDVRGPSPRSLALSVLLSCQRTNDALDELIERRAMSVLQPRDRALMMELVYGTLRRQETIDWRLGTVLAKPLHRLPMVVQLLLRLGAYQLLFLDRIPASAAVNETVLLTKSHADHLGRDWSGLVNAVLRNLTRIPVPPFPDSASHPARSLSVRYGIPLWLTERWIDRTGLEQAESACRASSTVPSVTLRLNSIRLTREELLERFRQAGVTAYPTAVSPVGVVLEKGQEVTSLPGFLEGDFYVEDEAAQLIPPILDPQPGETVLDACAAPGGKTTHLAELMGSCGTIYAVDRKAARVDILRQNCKRLGIHNIVPIVGDVRNPSEWSGVVAREATLRDGLPLFDRILVDAPCSGVGVLRRHPEAKGRKESSIFARHQKLQVEILAALASSLRPGGVLVYSVCSTETEETETVINRFCETNLGWMREPVTPWLPATGLSFVTINGALSTRENACGMDGFFAARLRKKE